ncbi:AAA-like domain-containing protein [Brunnivagina elsteri]|uniref:Diguanylate cyclase n=1 Tax=Brunnivagina elsteri CCALA 953 TaxID=987040 RepID=A0A2A2TFN6_9CYAN|nr:AAA-like domain-containing protein [Calothrix elsteri]PAX52501.1 diguanylate cyclase [Calothrix elsteri CCALA 953]
MTIEEVIFLLKASFPNTLTPLQELVLRSSWEGKTYTNIALEAHYGEERVRKVASSLWQLISDFWQEPIQKSNFRQVLELQQLNRRQHQLIKEFNHVSTKVSLEFPNGPVSIDSNFYICRPPIEQMACDEITEPGGAVCIKAPKKMGKSSLLLRILAHGKNLGYRTVSLDFQQADISIFTNIDKFLRWFCANVSRELDLEPKLNDYWNQDMGSKVSCLIYFQNYLLTSIEEPMILALNEIEVVLEYPEIARDFLTLLRSWYEQAKYMQVWQGLRLVMAYSSEILVPLRMMHSPFNIGLPIKLPPFSKEQVEDLAQRHGLDWCDRSEVNRLMGMVGGHPYLIRLALYYLVGKGELQGDLEQLLQQAPTESGIFDGYLRQYLLFLRGESELAAAFYEVIATDIPVKLELALAYRLQSLGLVNLEGDRVYPVCELFRLYFREQLNYGEYASRDRSLIKEAYRMEELERENQHLRVRSTLDELTQLANRRYFNTYLQVEWQRYPRENLEIPLSLILCDIDYFKIYNKTYGDMAGDDCLRKIAKTIQKCIDKLLGGSFYAAPGIFDTSISGNMRLESQSVLITRYSGEQFAIVAHADAGVAVNIAEMIRLDVKELGILCDYPGIGGLPASVLTVSLGVTSIVPDRETEPDSIIIAAEQALSLAKRRGRDRVVLG